MVTITPGTFLAITAAGIQLIKPMKTMTNINATIQRGLTGAESVFQLLDIEPENQDDLPDMPHIQGDIIFKNVTYAYDAEKPVLTHFNMRIKAGQTVALVGSSGSGKTTLVNLLPRFYEFSSGDILLDGLSIQKYSLTSLRQQFSWVGQHVILFNDTIANNIALGQGDINEDKLWAAIEKANASDFILQLPQGLHTIVGENGVSLSGGQRQRLALARAIYKDSPIFILDEATAALDNQTEQHIQRALEQFHHQRTMIIIAHRLSTIQFADMIFVMDQGQIVEQGRHDELLARNGHYAALYYAQHHTSFKHHEKPVTMV